MKPNVLLILNDDMGYSDIGCYGGEIDTPNLDSLAENGLRFTKFYNTARCCPSRASLLTGLHPHQADVGHMMQDKGVDGYLGDMSQNTATIAEVLKTNGYKAYMSGKLHTTRFTPPDGPNHNWPLQRGFDKFYGIIHGASDYFQPPHLVDGNTPLDPPKDPDYYFTDDISDKCCKMLREHAENEADTPFFTYLAYTAPHWPLHAPEKEIEKYKGKFDEGWDILREKRLERMKKAGIVGDQIKLSDRDSTVCPWDEEENKEWQTRRMEVYAAQVDIMDQGIGRVVQTLKDIGQFDNTIIIFLADNGGCAEELPVGMRRIIGKSIVESAQTKKGEEIVRGNDPSIIPGPDSTFTSYGVPWANVSDTPFRRYKHWVHEGGIATPFILHWPNGIKSKNGLRHQPYQLPDVMATLCDITGTQYPKERDGHSVKPCEGFSMKTCFENPDTPSTREVLYWEHEGNKAVRKGKWKLVCMHPAGQREIKGSELPSGEWELYDMEADRSETNNLIKEKPEVVEELTHLYTEWEQRIGVQEWEKIRMAGK